MLGVRNGGLRVLLIEDDLDSVRALGELLELEGYAVRTARSAADAIEVLKGFTPDAVIVDLQLPVMDGRTFIELYRRQAHPGASVIVMSGRLDGRTIAQSIGAEGFVRKPVDITELSRALSRATATA